MATWAPPSILLPRDVRTDENKESPPIEFHWKLTNPGDGVPQGNFTARHQCKQFHQAAALLVQRKRHRSGSLQHVLVRRRQTFSFKLDNAIATIVEDDKTNEIAVDTWFIAAAHEAQVTIRSSPCRCCSLATAVSTVRRRSR